MDHINNINWPSQWTWLTFQLFLKALFFLISVEVAHEFEYSPLSAVSLLTVYLHLYYKLYFMLYFMTHFDFIDAGMNNLTSN